MNIYVQQSISIQFLKVGSISNSSVLQIGSAGIIKSDSHFYNTGGFTRPAPTIDNPNVIIETELPPSVTLTSPIIELG